MTIKACFAGTDYVFDLPMGGHHLAENAMGVLACIAAIGLPADRAAAALIDCQPPSGRGQRQAAYITTAKSALLTIAITPAQRPWLPLQQSCCHPAAYNGTQRNARIRCDNQQRTCRIGSAD